MTFGEIVRARRAELGMTQEDVAHGGGPSVGTQRTIENGHAEQYQARTLRDLDDVLGWARGTSVGLLRGELTEPKVAEDSAPGPVVAEIVEPPSVHAVLYAVPFFTLDELERVRAAVNTAIAIRSEVTT